MTNRYNEYKLEYTRIVPCGCGCCSEYQTEEDYFDNEEKALEAFEDHLEYDRPRLYKVNDQGRYDLIKDFII